MCSSDLGQRYSSHGSGEDTGPPSLNAPEKTRGPTTDCHGTGSSGRNTLPTHFSTSGPLSRKIPRAAPPGGEAMAAIVSSRMRVMVGAEPMRNIVNRLTALVVCLSLAQAFTPGSRSSSQQVQPLPGAYGHDPFAASWVSAAPRSPWKVLTDRCGSLVAPGVNAWAREK